MHPDTQPRAVTAAHARTWLAQHESRKTATERRWPWITTLVFMAIVGVIILSWRCEFTILPSASLSAFWLACVYGVHKNTK